MNKQMLKETLGWGLVLWLIGYVLGFIFFAIIPPAYIGWVIMPIGAAITLLVLFKKIKTTSFKRYLAMAIVWTVVAVIFDYLFIVKMLNPADGYYKPDVYIYYALTFVLPLLVGLKKKPAQQ